jgi:hypothetical protein
MASRRVRNRLQGCQRKVGSGRAQANAVAGLVKIWLESVFAETEELEADAALAVVDGESPA